MSATDSKPVAVCVVVVRGGGVLAVSRRDDHSDLGLPGGKIESGETAEEAAVRELIQETGVIVDRHDLVAIYRGAEAVTGSVVETFYAAHVHDYEIVQGRGEGGVALWSSWPALEIGRFGLYNRQVRESLVDCVPEQWALEYGSGSLRRAIEEGMAWREMYLSERAAWEYGYGFVPAVRSRLTVGTPFAEGDSRATTETCWWARCLRYRSIRDKRSARVTVIHARLDDGDGGEDEGIAIRLEPDRRPHWLPADRILIAFTTNEHGATENPC